MIRTALTASALALALAPAAFAQPDAPPPPPPSVEASPPVPNPPPSTTNNNPAENADTGYQGDAQGSNFRDVDARIAAMETAMAGDHGALKQLRAIKAEAAMRRARHGGELRDWDRELINMKLNALGNGRS